MILSGTTMLIPLPYPVLHTHQHPIFSYRSMLSGLFPGLGIAIVAFSAYVLVDNLIHPDNVEELKRAAKESANRPSVLSLLRSNKGTQKEGEQQ
jgi:NADH dehydrogenase (ubiquinone) 1 beta subcomplex subunit 3